MARYLDLHPVNPQPRVVDQVVAAYAVAAYMAASKNGDFGRLAAEEKEQR